MPGEEGIVEGGDGQVLGADGQDPGGQVVKPQAGSDPQDWRAGLPEDLKAEKSLEAIKDVGGLAKSYVESQKMIGNSVRLPKEDAKPEEWDAFYAKMGRPEKPEEYGFVKPDQMPDGVTWNEDMVGWFGKAAHAAGLNKAQANALMNSWNEAQFGQVHQAQKIMKSELTALQDEWGPQFDARVELGLRGVEQILDDDEAGKFKELMNSTGLGNNPLMLKFAYRVGNMLKEDGYILGDGRGGILSADAAKEKIKAINADQKHPYWDSDAPGHSDAVNEMSQLFKLANQKR